MSEPERDVDQRLEQLRNRTQRVGPSPDFTQRVLAAAWGHQPPPLWQTIARAWWAIPVVGAIAVLSLGWALSSRDERLDRECASVFEAREGTPW